MGIFIKFECDECGEYECGHSYEQRMGIGKPKPAPLDPRKQKFSVEKTYYRGDIITDGEYLNLYIKEIYPDSMTADVVDINSHFPYTMTWMEISNMSIVQSIYEEGKQLKDQNKTQGE